jgi:hypothetical protein
MRALETPGCLALPGLLGNPLSSPHLDAYLSNRLRLPLHTHGPPQSIVLLIRPLRTL